MPLVLYVINALYIFMLTWQHWMSMMVMCMKVLFGGMMVLNAFYAYLAKSNTEQPFIAINPLL
jgi:hypothetical protein